MWFMMSTSTHFRFRLGFWRWPFPMTVIGLWSHQQLQGKQAAVLRTLRFSSSFNTSYALFTYIARKNPKNSRHPRQYTYLSELLLCICFILCRRAGWQSIRMRLESFLPVCLSYCNNTMSMDPSCNMNVVYTDFLRELHPVALREPRTSALALSPTKRWE